ncbi:hypothetical protein UREG_06954 [Uncinocarpus reesii 1704]|uniref:Uncharacterized protein n=1 Tax=Uncinocarpus reesii (strain UAMH 1704) TaxID=336963 RepID=C4JWL2_UNCRE|nr:uncharacterized protein UREG_06954 [Uncinocarpus reesii 1704]EEP82089.1 hypothetical protein UREG_06954 [Uncinocarpus reesii 1704]
MAETVSITICGDGGCVDGRPYFLALTDTAGQERISWLMGSIKHKIRRVPSIYDITNAPTLDALDYFMDMIDLEAENRLENNQRLIKQLGRRSSGKERVAVGMAAPVTIVAGNKCDLKDARVVSARQGLEWARRRGCGFMETSAREMVNIEETFALIVRRVVEARRIHYLQQFPPNMQTSPPQNSRPPMERTTSQLIAHSHTPPLTAHERALSDAVYQSQHDSSQKQWLGIGRALSKRIAKIRKNSDTPPSNSQTPARRRQSQAESSAGSAAKSSKRRSSTARSKVNTADVPHEAHQNEPNHSRGDSHQAPENGNPERWWKRLNCARA